jgi:hypothetical protein
MTTKRWGLAWGLAATILSGASGAALAAEPTAAEQAALTQAEARGAMIYAYDQAAWHSTDELKRRLPASALPAIRGWVVEPKDNLLRVTYFGLEDGVPHALFQADMRGAEVADSRVFTAGEDRALAAATLRLAQARLAAMDLGKTPCTAAVFNTVVVPPTERSGPAPVYLLSAMTTDGVYPFGGHYRVEVGPDGQVISQRPFTNACMNMKPGDAPKGAAGIGISHLLDPTPTDTEIHVFLSLWIGKPIFVVTGPDQIWALEAGKVRTVKAGGRP